MIKLPAMQTHALYGVLIICKKKKINGKPPDLTHRNSFTPGKKMGGSPQRSVKATVLSNPSCDCKHLASSYL